MHSVLCLDIILYLISSYEHIRYLLGQIGSKPPSFRHFGVSTFGILSIHPYGDKAIIFVIEFVALLSKILIELLGMIK